MSQTVLVTGATGTQGGAVADHLLSGDHGEFAVHALTRHPESAPAHDLAERGAEVVQGDLSEKNTLRPIVEEVDAVFGVTNFWEHGYDDEIEQGTNLVEVADEVGVDHFVFSSVGGAERDTGIPHFDSKWEIEELVRDLDLPATVVRPVFFMQNFEAAREDIENGTLANALAEGVSLQMVAPDDIGGFVAEAFADPDRYVGESYELAGDEHTLESAADVFSEVLDREVEAVHVPLDEFREQMGEEYAVMFEWFNEAGYEADIEALRADHDVEFTDLETYLRGHGWGSADRSD
ncbi:NmrA/HSCARG family protein [Halorussus gelatinilyticus]|uniref:NmrA/HSCARG family protein n=1 Tax=Halorussus gelatinilyticus TaxID=2937524 RepID=A0A8U0II60_9EURY|nr:NmrA/HSCARG family protein [Halorussus gelatinilyticus]UPW00703.1 NmrA/HSCARG family protein [Halorussus gelatinilyticus]